MQLPELEAREESFANLLDRRIILTKELIDLGMFGNVYLDRNCWRIGVETIIAKVFLK